METVEKMVQGYPRSWNAIELRDYLLRYGSVLRTRTHVSFGFVIFDSQRCDLEIPDEEYELVFSNPKKKEEIDLEEVPHISGMQLEVGFSLSVMDQVYFCPLEKVESTSLLTLNEKKNLIELRFEYLEEKTWIEYELSSIENCFYEQKMEFGKLLIQLNRPPRFYQLKAKDPNFKYWKIGLPEPGWKRSSNLFDSFSDILVFEVKKFTVCITFKTKFESNFLKAISKYLKVTPKLPCFRGLPRNYITTREINSLSLEFSTKFMIYSILSLCYVSCFHLTEEFLKSLEGRDETKVRDALQWIIISQKGYAPRRIESVIQLFEEIYSEGISFPYKAEGNYFVANRVIITPTTFYCFRGEPELSNRVLRKYSEFSEDFLRVTFTDEDLNQILPYSQEMEPHIKRNLQMFKIAKKRFRVLAYSASQLRSHSVWMFCDSGRLTGESIRNWLGDFSRITNPGKYVARLGQPLASCIFICTLEPSEVSREPDIQNESYVFSDGIGKISRELTELVNATANCDSSAFQIRMGGAKGVVALDPRLSGRQVVLRDSMVKFESGNLELDLLNHSEFRSGYLNRQIIMLLSSLGIPDSSFEELLMEMLIEIENNFYYYISSLRQDIKNNLALQFLNQIAYEFNEPVIIRLKNLLKELSLLELKKKHKILVKKSGVLIGVLDEYQLLEYGEVFVQVERTGVLEGPVVVVKNPCLHPGDVRVLQAKNIPELQHHKDVVVFPSKGKRPHPNECSGSDLDGDLYFITWDTRLIPAKTCEPMKYDEEKPIYKDPPLGIKDLIDFFWQFVTNDKLGQIDNAHLAVADQSEEYAFDEKCIELCKKHAIAVDFPKNGIVVDLPKHLKPKGYPDFMEKDNEESYLSQKILGKIHRKIIDSLPDPLPQMNPKRLVAGFEDHLETANYLFGEYSKDIKLALNQYEISSEVEFLTAQVLKLSRFYNKKRRELETKQTLTYIANQLIEKHTKRFQEAGGTPQLASACYFVSHEQGFSAYAWMIGLSLLVD